MTGELVIPVGVTEIGERAFEGCSGLTGEIRIPTDATVIGKRTFMGCSGLTGELKIPEGVTKIGSAAFYMCSGLTGELKIPSGVTEIGDSAFYKCSGFTGSLILPNGITEIGSNTFYGCNGLTGELTIPSGVTTIGIKAFAECYNLTGKVTIPASVTEIEVYFFTEPYTTPFTNLSQLTIYGVPGTYAEDFAQSVGATFIDMNSAGNDTPQTYIGNVNSELLKFTYDESTNYLSGEIVVVEWVNGESTVPSVKPIMTFDAVDGSESIEVFVTATGTNTYYFDRLLGEGLTPGKEYIFNVTSGNELNVSEYATVPIYTGTSSIGSEGVLGAVGEQAVCYKTDAATGYLLVYGRNDTYKGNVNSVLSSVQCVTAENGDNFVSGNIVIVEWVNGESTVPTQTPKMTFESYDGTECLDVFMACLDGTNTYYFDRNLTEDMDVTKDYIFRISLTDDRNISKYKSMVATTNYMEEKEGMLWETATQKVMYKTVAADGDNQLRIYAVTK